MLTEFEMKLKPEMINLDKMHCSLMKCNVILLQCYCCPIDCQPCLQYCPQIGRLHNRKGSMHSCIVLFPCSMGMRPGYMGLPSLSDDSKSW